MGCRWLIMKDKYTGDVGDFGKYGMINELCNQSKIRNSNIRLGINWYYTTNDEYKDLFSWNDVPGNSNELRKFLNRYDIELEEKAKFEKIDNGTTINVSTKNNSISLRLNNEKTKVNLTIDYDKTHEFIARMTNGSLKISEKNRDGGFIEYLDNTYKYSKEFRRCFPKLYDKLQTIVKNGRRTINEIEKSEIFPVNTIFYSNPLPLENIRDERGRWFTKSLEELQNVDIIFLDPDNGIQINRNKSPLKSIKYAFTDEIKEYYDMGKSLIIYTEIDRRDIEHNKKISGIRDYINPDGILVLRFKQKHFRDYIFLIQKKHQDLINETIKVLVTKHDFLFRYYDLKLQQAFQKVFGFSIPIPITKKDLQPIEGKPFLLGSPISLQKQFLLQGYIDEFLEFCPAGYFLIGFWGHGLMSDGFYYSRVDSWSKIFFRLPYTGAYYYTKDVKEMARCVREFLIQFIEFEKLISKKAKTLIAVESMGDGYYKIVMLNGKTYEIDRSLFDKCNLLKELSDLCEI
jgi:hypothetical protein